MRQGLASKSGANAGLRKCFRASRFAFCVVWDGRQCSKYAAGIRRCSRRRRVKWYYTLKHWSVPWVGKQVYGLYVHVLCIWMRMAYLWKLSGTFAAFLCASGGEKFTSNSLKVYKRHTALLTSTYGLDPLHRTTYVHIRLLLMLEHTLEHVWFLTCDTETLRATLVTVAVFLPPTSENQRRERILFVCVKLLTCARRCGDASADDINIFRNRSDEASAALTSNVSRCDDVL